MKKFSLNTKRASKVLALALVAALVVPNVPAQKSVVYADDEKVELPEAIAEYSFEDETGLTFVGTGTSLQLKKVVSGDATAPVTEKSVTVDVPVTDEDGNPVYSEIDVRPAIIEDGAVGNALSLKTSKANSGAYDSDKNAAAGAYVGKRVTQDAITYHSAVEITNPFAKYRSDLYDATRYNFDNIMTTATEQKGKTITSPALELTPFYAERHRYSGPEAKTGITISFWANVPYVETDKAMGNNAFFEFYNRDALLLQGDDMAKVYVATQWAKVKDKFDTTDDKSPFYIAEPVTGTAVAVGSDVGADFEAINGNAFSDSTPTNDVFTYVPAYGYYMSFNEKVQEIAADAVIETTTATKNDESFVVYITDTVSTDKTAKSNEIVVDSGKTTSAGEPIYYHLRRSYNIYTDYTKNPNYLGEVTKETPYGKARVGRGAIGYLFASSNPKSYGANIEFQADDSVMGSKVTFENEACKQNGEQANIQKGNGVRYSWVLTSRELEDEWHYYTVTITDEWFQMYIDGEALNPDQAEIWSTDNGKAFNLSSGLVSPTTGWRHVAGNKITTDYSKLGDGVAFNGGMSGYVFGETVMDMVSSQDTKFYIGGKLHATVEGSLIDEMSFYKEKMSDKQVKAAYDIALKKMQGEGGSDLPDPEPAPDAIKTVTFEDDSDIIAWATGQSLRFTETQTTADYPLVSEAKVLLGDMNGNGKREALDALAILDLVASGKTDPKEYPLANVDQNTKIDALDALKLLDLIAAGKVTADDDAGGSDEKTFPSYDYIPAKDPVTEEYIWDDLGITPEITEDAIRGSVLELKNPASTVKFPKAAPNAASEIQHAATYNSAVEIENPFVKYRSDLYDASRYNFDNIMKTATEQEGKIDASLATEGEPFYADKVRYSGPEAKTGVTISFWANVPYVEKDKAMGNNAFFEFYNRDALLLQGDDMAKVYIATQWAKVKNTFNTTDDKSPFYIAAPVQGTAVDVGTDVAGDFTTLNGAAFDAASNNTFKYVPAYGYYLTFNEKVYDIAADAAIETTPEDAEGYQTYVVYITNSVSTSHVAANDEIVVDSGKTNSDNEKIYYHLKRSANIYTNYLKNPNYLGEVTEKTPYGEARVGRGAIGYLFASSNPKSYGQNIEFQADDSVMGSQVTFENEACKQNGEQANIQKGNGVRYSWQLAAKELEDEWHYYTFTITDEWFQMYIDGVACDPDQAEIWSNDNGKAFNLSSGLVSPTTGWRHVQGNKVTTDYSKLGSGVAFNGWMSGYVFGETVMDMISSPDTKLYIGGKLHATVEGSRIDDVSFYKEALTPGQVASVYLKAQGMEPEE